MKNFIRKVMSDTDLLLTYEQILVHPIGHQEKISEGFFTERLPSRKNVIFFRVELAKGVRIPYGIHDCFEEIALYSGRVVETYTNTNLSKLETFKIKPYKKHGFLAVEDSVFYAYLYK